MKYESVVTFGGKQYQSFKSENVATLSQRLTMARITWGVMKVKPGTERVGEPVPWLRTRVMWIIFKYSVNPKSCAYYYVPLETS